MPKLVGSLVSAQASAQDRKIIEDNGYQVSSCCFANFFRKNNIAWDEKNIYEISKWWFWDRQSEKPAVSYGDKAIALLFSPLSISIVLILVVGVVGRKIINSDVWNSPTRGKGLPYNDASVHAWR